MPHRCELAPVEDRLTWPLQRYDRCSPAARRSRVEWPRRRCRRLSVVDGHQRAADDATCPSSTLLHAKQRSIRRGVKVGEHSLVRIRAALRVGAEGEIEDRRVARQARSSGAGSPARDRSSDQTNVSRSRNRLNSLSSCTMPELAELSGPHHHEHLPGLGQQLQDVVDQSEDNRCRPRRRSRCRRAARRAEIARSTAANRSGVSGNSCWRCLRAKTARRAGERHDQVRLGTIGEGGSDVVDDRLFGRADKPCWAHDDLDDVHRASGALDPGRRGSCR